MAQNNIGCQPPKLGGAFVIRRADGTPRIDDINNIPPVILEMLTPEDLKYIEQLRNTE